MYRKVLSFFDQINFIRRTHTFSLLIFFHVGRFEQKEMMRRPGEIVKSLIEKQTLLLSIAFELSETYNEQIVEFLAVVSIVNTTTTGRPHFFDFSIIQYILRSRFFLYSIKVVIL